MTGAGIRTCYPGIAKVQQLVGPKKVLVSQPVNQNIPTYGALA